MTAVWCIAVIGLLGAWLPVETRPGTAVLLSAGFLVLLPWAWRRTRYEHATKVASAVVIWMVFLTLGLSGGWDRSHGLGEVALAGAVLGLIWLASRERPSAAQISLWAVGIAALSLWGLAQSWGGLEQIRPAIDQLPSHLRLGALARIDQGRAFASLYLPGHLAALLATALPILVARIGRNATGLACAAAAVAATLGLVATRSPIGGFLAGAACITVVASRRSKIGHALWIVPIAAIVLVMGLRPDVLDLEPLRLRVDNWSAALWTWQGSPFGSVACGGFGQASQAVPWELGNHPAHAHSFPLEWLADLGIAGLAAWTALMMWLLKIARSLWGTHPELAVALLVIPLHNMLDFSLYTSGVALPWAVLAGWCAVLAAPNQPSQPTSPPLRIVPVVLTACVVAVALLNAAGALLEREAKYEGERKLEYAFQAAALAPWRTGPVDAVGRLALEVRDPATFNAAADLVRRRQWQRPRSASRAQLLGRLAQIENDPVAAVAHLWRAARLQPHDPRRRDDYQQLVDRLRENDHGAR